MVALVTLTLGGGAASNTGFIIWGAICLVPVWAWLYLVSEPLPVADSLNFRFLFSGTAPDSCLQRRYVIGKGYLFPVIFFVLAAVPTALKNIVRIILNTFDIFVRVKRLPVQVRTAVALFASTLTLIIILIMN